MLTQACLVTKKVIHIGITSDILLTKKAYSTYIEPYAERERLVRDFVTRLAPNLEVCFFELQDPVGIAGELSELQACILTKETQKGGEMINEARSKNGLPPLELVFADMILTSDPSSEADEKFSNKMSSTMIRKYLDSTTAEEQKNPAL